ncbi:MAG TPA: CvpA family protein [Stellaceae bacterium]|nr:CvpA family protein [Stellaceae bacterium]
MNALDICVVGVIILSGLMAFARGFVRECLSIASWLGATAAALYGLPYLRPFAEHYVPKGTFADAAAAGVLFIVTLVVLSIIAGMIARQVKHSSLSALDRTLGLLFGLGRGALLVTIGFLALSFALPQKGEKPNWLAQSRTAPLFSSATAEIARLAPGSLKDRVMQVAPQQPLQNQFENALRAYSIPATRPGGSDGNGPGPSSEDQQRLNQLIRQLDKSQSPDPEPNR